MLELWNHIVADFAPEFPADPEQQQTAGEDQPDDAHQPRHDQREEDTQHQRGADADQDDLLALLGGETGGEGTDDDRVVAGQDEIDHQNRSERGQCLGIAEVGEVRDDVLPDLQTRAGSGGSRCGGGQHGDNSQHVSSR